MSECYEIDKHKPCSILCWQGSQDPVWHLSSQKWAPQFRGCPHNDSHNRGFSKAHFTVWDVFPQPQCLWNKMQYDVNKICKTDKVYVSGNTFLLVPYLTTCARQGGQGPGWQSNVQRWTHKGRWISRDFPQTSPHVWGVSWRFHRGSTALLQKQRYWEGTASVTFWHAGQRQPVSGRDK